MITLEEAENILKQWTNSTLIIELKGIINTKLIILESQVKVNSNKIEFISKENIQIGFIKHQIMKIENINQNIIIQFDNLQTVIIRKL